MSVAAAVGCEAAGCEAAGCEAAVRDRLAPIVAPLVRAFL